MIQHTSPADPRSAVKPAPLLHPLTSIVDRLDWASVFPEKRPVEVELGAGDCSFLLELARLRPDHNFLGVERMLGRLRKLDRKGRRAGLTNLRGLRVEAAYCLEYLLPLEGVEALHVYFPDPWPKRRHWRRRLVNERFPDLAARVLRPGGWIHLRTDHPDYFQQMRHVFAPRTAFREVPVPDHLAALETDFEREFVARGVTILRLSYRCDTDGSPDAPRTTGCVR
ncbi:MAG: tRNA (guanosine(46)-N7)-methyltransferase TrmB [Verrucomicrobia bacterium]|jgi:tRNA (guanine-N7-)-methyltransferase|nr:tRNA (guanosine(46)-N7)-methyltransferase TrmB [Verrucomicrobiota bacterium]OQC62613.1 MAG: tRNA (guanine-N(7)-)-methyltransferase [Verrucomicrobia bacterium ADurb.Bin006]MDI9381156.1 tRNA (guanosine(46)-N7)-methyltransferase TrmB [Verrucomicrobiota bacterium]NMD20744.1 tRNA (guanosine(46)-N7)-methyltransferase TrmB [Verrucomicrobiota bacterium]HNV00731.1 tRNA (guanosine(46)-N7)-methyltransferase TrmB [Verrucomicrobiota bacterium]